MIRSKTFQALVLILFVSVLLRVAVAIWLGNEVDAPPLLTDQRSYHALGVRLSTGHGFSFDRPWYPFYLPADSPTAHWSYLYSLFVGLVYAIFGPQVVAARLVQAILGGIVLPLAVYQLTRRILGSASSTQLLTGLRERGLNTEALPVVAAGVAAIYFYFVLYAATLMTETFFITALLWSLDRAIALADAPTIKNGLALGVGLAAATLLRQSVLPGIAVIVLWLLWAAWRARRLRQGACRDRRFRRCAGCGNCALHDSKLQGVWRFAAAQFKCRLRHVFGAASHAWHILSGFRSCAVTRGLAPRQRGSAR